MDAFWSGTDDANENMTQFYGVWGKVMDDQPNFLFRWVSGDTKENIDHSILFDIPVVTKRVITEYHVPGQEVISETTEEYAAFKGPWEHEEYPEDWFGQHSKSFGAGVSYGRAGSYGKGRGTYTSPYSGYNYDMNDDYYEDWYNDTPYGTGAKGKPYASAANTNTNRFGNHNSAIGNLEAPYAKYQKKNLQ